LLKVKPSSVQAILPMFITSITPGDFDILKFLNNGFVSNQTLDDNKQYDYDPNNLVDGFSSEWQLLFQNPATERMERIIDLHHDIMFFVVAIVIFVL
jgi:hypothetical protein